uniref:Gibberellin 20-oxidase 1 n=1 Tax=Solanum tuberosum TaxID=4113 RepID=M1DZJ1_SOLTU
MKHDVKDCVVAQDLPVPLIDIGGFFYGDHVVAQQTSRLVGEVCSSHSFFLVVNHGVDVNLISNAHRYMDMLFDLLSLKRKKISEKLVRIVAMPAALLECFCRSCLGKRLSLFNTLLKKTHLT